MADANDFILGGYPDGFDPTGNIEDQATAASDEMMLDAEKSTLDEFSRVTACLRGATGRAFLDWMRSKTVDQPAFFPENYPLGSAGAVIQLPAAEQGFIREGQNMVFREITRMMAVVDAGPSANLTTYLSEKEAIK